MDLVNIIFGFIWSALCFISLFYDIGSSSDENSKDFSGNEVKVFFYISFVYILLVVASFEPIHQTGCFRGISYSIFAAMLSVYFGVFYNVVMFLERRYRFFDRTPPLWARKLSSKDKLWKGVLFFTAAKEFFSTIGNAIDRGYSFLISIAG